jgi:hypothetical protein
LTNARTAAGARAPALASPLQCRPRMDTSFRRLASLLFLAASTAACTEPAPPPVIGPPPPPPPGTAVFSTADESLLRKAVTLGALPASDILDFRVSNGRWSAQQPYSSPQCPVMTETGPRSYTVAGPCTVSTGAVFEGTASATNAPEDTLNHEDTVVDPQQPTIYEAHAFRSGGADLIDGRVERSSPRAGWWVGHDVTTTATVTWTADGVRTDSQLALVSPVDAFGFRYADGSKVAIAGLGDYEIHGQIERGWSAAGGGTFTGWIELRGKETLRASFDDATDPSRCVELTLDGQPFGSLCPPK